MAGTISVGGLISGINTSDIISKLMEIERQPLVKLEERKSDLQAKAEAWRELNSRLYKLKEATYNLQSFLTFRARKTNVQDETVLSATASVGAAASTYNIDVKELAKAHTITSDSQTSASTSLGLSGAIQIKGKNIEITTVDTLNSIADKINATDEIGVTASVIQLGTDNYKLTLTSTETGVENAITLVDGGDVLTSLGVLDAADQIKNETQAAQDAEVWVNGLQIFRAENSISDIINGVTLNLKRVGTTTLTVETDTEKIVSAVKEFVENYNSVMSYLNENMTYSYDEGSKTGTAGVLFGESSLMFIHSQLRGYLSKTVSGVAPEVNSLSMVGISTGAAGSDIEKAKAGLLELDETKFLEKLETHFDDVMKLFGAAVTNVAAARNGGAVAASSEYSADYPAASIIDGRTSSDDWGQGGGWNDATADTFPDWVEISFSRTTTIDQINIYTLNSETYPAATYGIKDFDLEYWDSSSSTWKLINSFTDNTQGLIAYEFSAVATDKVRLTVKAANGANDYSRLVEVQVYEQNNGIFSDMYDQLFEWTRADGLMDGRADSLNEQISDLTDQIEVFNERLAKKEEYYLQKFTAMETALAKMQSQSSWLTSQLAALSAQW